MRDGGTPLTALLIVGWPRETLSFDLLGDVLAGAAEILAGAGVTIVGGHSVDDPEPKFGLAVTGTIHPDRVLRNQGARPGDLLVLTKPIGTGVIATGIKRGVVSQEIRDAAVLSMTALNDTAGRVAVEAGAAAATDVTGFGLLGTLARCWEQWSGSRSMPPRCHCLPEPENSPATASSLVDRVATSSTHPGSPSSAILTPRPGSSSPMLRRAVACLSRSTKIGLVYCSLASPEVPCSPR